MTFRFCPECAGKGTIQTEAGPMIRCHVCGGHGGENERFELGDAAKILPTGPIGVVTGVVPLRKNDPSVRRLVYLKLPGGTTVAKHDYELSKIERSR